MSFSEWSNKKKKKEQEEKTKTKSSMENSFSEWSNKKHGVTDEYWEMRKSLQAKKSSVADDIAPVRTTTKKKDDGFDFFQKGAFEDGYQFGDVTKSILGTVGDVGVGVIKGAEKMVGGIIDAGYYGVAGIADAMDNDDFADRLRKKAQKNVVDDSFAPLDEKLDKYSLLGRTGDAISEGIGQVGTIILTGGLGAAAGLGTVGATALTTGAMGVSSFGSGVSEAYQGGATDEEAATYGLIKGVVDAGSEMIFGGLGKTVKAIGLSKGLSSLDDMFAQKLTSKITNQVAKNFVEFGVKASAEGVEEVLAGIGSAVGKKLTYMDEKELSALVKDENLLEQFVVGAVTSGISQSGIVPSMRAGSLAEANKTGRDFISGNSVNEQKVIDKVYEDRIAEESKNGEVSKKRKNEIYDEVVSDMEKGYLSIDTIEEVLGGDTYKNYKSISEQEDSLKSEFDELNKMKQGEMTGEQIDRRAELKQKLEEIKNTSQRNQVKNQLGEEVFGLVQNDRLLESYNERSRKGQAFEADLTQYKGKQQEVIKKAVDSGILNNTRRTHEFVEMVSKISADKGVLFDFTNNERLKESGFAVDGKTVNGYVTKDGVTLNIQSAKSLNSVVGHEITHVLEGTELYDVLQKTIVDYAKYKGDYNSRIVAAAELYKNIEGADPTAEVTADLVGDYLFTDPDFIKSLSTNKNVFQKIYDEIKYLCKVATAGSKEARELEKVRRAFEKAYQEDSKQSEDAESEVQYSLVEDQKTIDFLENQDYIVTYKAMQVVDGKLYPPMSAQTKETVEYTDKKGNKKTKTVSKWKQPSELGKWQQSDENPSAIKKFNSKGVGVFDLIKGNGKTIQAAYNPYEHTSNIVLNDQFEEAYNRDNLVTVEYHIPVSELTSGYKAQYAKDAVGLHEWKSGPVAKDLKDPRKVYLTRWSKPVRILPDSEVAAKYKEILDGTGLSVPFNVVTPSLLSELEKAGVSIDYEGSPMYKSIQRRAAEKKAKYSVSDSNGKQLTTEQQEYFKDSKARDKDGNLLTLYHGTQANFTVFDLARSGENYNGWGEFGEGIYLTPSKKTAEYYGDNAGWGREVKVMELYADIRNPFNTTEEVKIDISDLTEKYNLTEGDERYIKKYGYRLIDFLKEKKESVYSYLSAHGYDGVWEKTLNGVDQIVVYAENQVKNTDNLKPTKDVDIRYSVSDSDGKKLTKEQSEFFKDSKMRNDNGELMVMYHGSQDAGFHVFDNSFSDDETSFFFVDRNEVATSYSGTEEVYEARTIRTVDDMNNFLEEIGEEDYKVIEKDGKFTLLQENEKVADSDTAQGIYEEYCDWVGVGYGDANYKVYLNLKNPLIVDAEDRNWDNISREFSQEMYDRYKSLTEEEKEALVQLAAWEDYSIFQDELAKSVQVAGYDETQVIRNAYAKLVGTDTFDGDEVNRFDLFSIASDNFSEESLREFAVKQMNTRDYAQRAREQGYDGVIFKNIHDNGGYSNGSEGASTVAIAFESNQIKSTANEKPTADNDIRYSLSELDSWYQSDLENDDMIGADLAVERAANLAMPDSKIRDEHGNLIPVYHGTKEMFNVFDTSVKGGLNGTAEGFGIYTSDDPEVTEAYGNRQIKMYANITKPATSDKKTISTKTLSALIKDTCQKQAQKAVEDGEYDSVKDALFDTWVSNYVYTYDTGMERAYREVANTILQMNDNDMDIIQEVMASMAIRNYAEAYEFYHNSLIPITGFDGYVTEWENSSIGKKSKIILAFDSNQLKSADTVTYDDNGNVIPLSERFNPDTPDIRYSLSKDGAEHPVYGKYNVYGKDIALETAPVREDIDYDVIDDILSSGRISNTVANRIIRDPALSRAFTNVTGTVLEGTTEQKRKAIQQTVRERSFIAQENETLAMDAAEQAQADYAREQDENAVKESGYRSYIRGIFLRGATIADAREILSSPELKAEWEAATNKTLPTNEKSAIKMIRQTKRNPMNMELPSIFPDEVAPMAEDETATQERLESLDESDAPPEAEAPQAESEEVTVDNPFDKREWKGIGDKKIKAFTHEHPEALPFFQAEARVIRGELNGTIKGERWYNDDLYYQSSGEEGYGGTKRLTSDSIAEMLDDWGMSYANIEKGLDAIIDGNVNIAAAKKIEFMINDRLLHGYKEFFTNEMIPPDEEYISLLNEIQNTEHNAEMVDSLATDNNAPPISEEIDDIAPVPMRKESNPTVTESYEAIRPKREKQPKLARATPEEQARIAEIMDEEPTPKNKKRRAWAKFKANVLDKGAVFEDLSLKHKNRELMGKWNYILSSESRAQRLMGNGNGNVKSLNAIREEVGKTGKTKQFYEYLYHKHNVDRMTLAQRYENKPNKPVFGDSVTADVSQKYVDQYEQANPQFKQYAEDVYTYMNYLRQQLVDSGVISQDTANLWSEMYPHYVPIRRAGDEGLNINVPLDTGKTGVNAPIKRATGGSRDILPLFDTMGQRTLQTYKAIAKNNFGVELKNTLKATSVNEATNLDEVIDSIDAQEGLLQEGKDGRSPTFTVFENGEKVTFEITEDMYDALKPVSELLTGTNKILRTASSFHRGVLTEYNPVFMLNNALKDAQDVLINSQHPAKTYAKIPEAYAQLIKKGYWYNEYMNNGGEQNTYFDKQTNTFSTGNKGLSRVLDLPPFSTISALNNFIEMTPRLAEYIASREAGRSVEVAMLDAARVTTNFQAGGDLTKFLNRNGATFLNASVQGAMQNVRNFREAKANGLKGYVNLATKFAIAGLPAIILNNLVWDDDEEYEELSDYVKQNYYVVGKYDDGKFIRIPKGRTLAVIQEAVTQIANTATGDDELDLSRFLELAVSNLAPNNPIENNILSPIVQVASNETWYGEDLVPSRLSDLPAAEQFDESTDSISKWLGEKLDISPVKINYLLDQYSGGVGDVVLPMLTPEAERGNDSVLGNMIAPLQDKFTTDSVMKNQNVSDFYETKDELTTNAKRSNSTDDDALKYKYINSVNAEMSELYAQKREIQNSDLPNAEKYNAVREIQKQIDALAEEGLATYEGITYEDDYREGGEYARVGDRVFKKNDEGEWSKLSDDQLTKYEVTKAAGNANYATDGTNHYRWYEPSEDADEDTEAGWRKVTDKELEKQNEVTKGLGISPKEYWSNKEEYSYAYEHPENYAVAKAVGGYEAYRGYSSELYDIKADKDSSGKSISGSRKEKVLDYINGLDADYGEKIILFKSEYPSYDDANYDIIDYLNGRDDISYEEMETILKKLGFTVDSNGNISW